MDHDSARRLMAESLEGTGENGEGKLGSDDERDLALHLIGCEECKTIYEGLQQAHPALSSIDLGEPSSEAIDAAVHRASTVLRGEADPGPMGLSDEPPRLPDHEDSNTIRIDTSSARDDEMFMPPGASAPTGPIAVPPVSPHETTGSAVTPLPVAPPSTGGHVRAIEPETAPAADDDDLDIPLFDDDPVPAPPADPAPVLSTGDLPTPPPAAAPIAIGGPRTEMDRLLDDDRNRFEQLAYDEDPEDDDRTGPMLWLVAIAVTVVLAVIAGILIFRGGNMLGGGGDGDLPSSDEVQRRVAGAFSDMKSLKATFDIQRLGLYRVGREEDSLVYSFSNGRFAGSIDYDRAEAGYHQEYALDVGGDEVDRLEVVQTSDETQSLSGTGDARSLLVEQNPPLGPPDGAFRPTFGILEDSLGTAARLLSEAENLEVHGTTERDGVELFEVSATLRPDELSRGDRIEAALDSNFFPVIVKRSISRENARVLGPPEAMAEEDLDKAFGDNERITTELVELRKVQYDEIVLPGDLVVDAPEGIEPQNRDFGYERLTRAELASTLDFEPMLPRTLPDGYEEQLLAVYTGEPAKWGPNGTLPEPESVFHSNYFDGKTTIALTQRRMEQRFSLRGSPLQRTGLPITIEEVGRGGNEFFYGTSPELPPHVYGFLDNTFVMAAGYAPQADLLRILTSLAETAPDVPSVDGSPDPSASPLGSATGSPSASASPLATFTPSVTPAPTTGTGGLPAQ